MRTILALLVGMVLGLTAFVILMSFSHKPEINNSLVARHNRSLIELEKRVYQLRERVDYLEYEVEKYSNIWAVLTRNKSSIYSQ